MTRSGPKNARHCALRYLSFRSRTESEVYEKLTASGFSKAEVRSTVEKLKSQNLVNDDNLAREWTQLRTVERSYGPLLVKRELRQRGVARDIIERVIVETFADGQEVARATETLGRRFAGADLSDVKIRKRAEGFLVRRGYNRSVIADVLGENLAEAEA